MPLPIVSWYQPVAPADGMKTLLIAKPPTAV